MSKHLTIKKGRNLHIAGGVTETSPVAAPLPSEVAIVPDDFHGFIPKVDVAEGDAVKVGSPILHDKRDEAYKLVSPVSGTVKAVVRGERRKIERIVIAADGKQEALKFELAANPTADDARMLLKSSGLLAMMRQRPYDIVPNHDSTPRDIFVTALDTAPLATTPNVSSEVKAIEAGVKLLRLLTDGKVHITFAKGCAIEINGAETYEINTLHPAGNVGTQIAAIAPINKGDVVWTMDIQTLIRIGNTVISHTLSPDTLVAVTGSEVKKPCVLKTVVGAGIESLVKGNIADSKVHKRIISGNVLTGVKVGADGFLRYPYRQVTVIPEGDDVNEFMGWASLSPKKMSGSRSFPGHFLFHRLFRPDARIQGGKRALIMSGEYDALMPIDVMAEYLLKAVIGRDIEKMEQLGIYEVAPEDFALGEYADTSKTETQKIIREGLDYLRKELE